MALTTVQQRVTFIKINIKGKLSKYLMGYGVFHKIYVSFESPFWDTTKLWIGFFKENGKSKYPMAKYISDNGKFILCFISYASEAVEIRKMPDEQIKEDIVNFLSNFYPSARIVVRDFFVTRWNEDPLALGSYSFEKIGPNTTELIATICEPLQNKVWFAGEHCHPTQYSYSHTAFQTGVWVAGNFTQLLRL